VGETVYIGREVLFNSQVYVIYHIDTELEIYYLIEAGYQWDYKEGIFKSWDGMIGRLKQYKYEDLMSFSTALEFVIDKFGYLINRQVAKSTPPSEYNTVKDEIIKRITKKLYDNR
jgi:hypothetical protein